MNSFNTVASCTIILPNEVRPNILTNISDLSIYGISIYNDIREITKSDVDRSNNVIVIGKVPLNSISDLKLYKEVFNLNLFFISEDSLMCSIMSDFCVSYNLDYSRLDYSLILSVIFNDTGSMDAYKLKDYKTQTDSLAMAKELVHEPEKNVSNLAKDFLVLRESYLEKLKVEKELKEEISRINSDLLGLTRTNESIMAEIVNLISQYNEHYNKLKDYKIFFTEDVYDTINLSKYKRLPKIIYFKEYSELIHFNSFINTLCDVIKSQGNSSFKLVRLHDSCDVHRIKTLEDSYFTINNKFIQSDVIVNDIILSYGNYVRLFDTIFNSTSLEYLIVVDCKKFDNVVFIGDYLRFNLCRNPNDLEKLGLTKYNTIVNNDPNNVMSWNTYDRYKEFINPADRFVYLSSRPVMKYLFSEIFNIK